MANATATIAIEVIYALPQEQILWSTRVSEGSSIRAGIQASGILNHYPELDLDTLNVGVFGKAASLQAALREGDRIEIYRPLIADPKEVRKQRAAAGKTIKKGC